MTEPKDAIWDTGFDHERQEPPKTEFTDFQSEIDAALADPTRRARVAGFEALLHEGERVVTAEQAARDPAKVYCPLCLHPTVHHKNSGTGGYLQLFEWDGGPPHRDPPVDELWCTDCDCLFPTEFFKE